MKLNGKVAVITGATSGLALATAKLFVAEGAYVYITGRRQLELDLAVASIGRNVTGIQGDVAISADLDRLFESVSSHHGYIDILYASAGAGDFGIPLGEITEDAIDRTFDVNIKGTMFTVQKALPLFRNGGSIIMTGSIAHIKSFPAMSIYNASKAALPSIARTWMQELKDRQIRINVISPGPIETNAFAAVDQGIKDFLMSKIPLGRFGKPEEIASAALFLASSDSSFINGIELCVDGGTAQI